MQHVQKLGTKYLAVIAPTRTGWSGSFPDVLGCVATGSSADELKKHLSEALALHLSALVEDGDSLPAARTSSINDLDEHEEVVWIEPAEMNPVSLLIAQVIEERHASLRKLEAQTGISYAVLSRLQDPFYWGHTMKSLRMFAEAFGLKPVVSFQPEEAA